MNERLTRPSNGNRRWSAGVTGALAVVLVAVVLVPYFVVPPKGTQVYYNISAVGPVEVLWTALAVIGLVLAERAGLVSAPFAAGLVFALGAAMVAIAGTWALAVPPAIPMELSYEEWLLVHRWVVLGATVGTFLSATWYGTGALSDASASAA